LKQLGLLHTYSADSCGDPQRFAAALLKLLPNMTITGGLKQVIRSDSLRPY